MKELKGVSGSRLSRKFNRELCRNRKWKREILGNLLEKCRKEECRIRIWLVRLRKQKVYRIK